MGFLNTGDQKMDMTDDLNAELSDFEAQIASEINKIKPNVVFVDDLRDRLLGSRIFEYRRSIGAILVASFSVLLMGTLSYCVGRLFSKAKKIVSR